jgi:putative hemin transport protein
MSDRVSSLAPEVVERIRTALRTSPSQMTLQLARHLNVPEVEVIRAMPEGRSVELDATRWEDIFHSFPELGKVHVIVSNESVTCEVVGEFGGFSSWGEFFNVQTKTLDMHIRFARLAAVFALEKPSHMDGVSTLSFQFFDQGGAAALKVYLSFGGQNASPQRQALFQGIRERFRKRLA